MKITDKQRIDFVQRHMTWVKVFGGTKEPFLVCQGFKLNRLAYRIIKARGRTWRQAVDKAIKAFQKGNK